MNTILTLRRHILERLCHHLQTHYCTDFSSQQIVDGNVSAHELTALLSFKSDPRLDAYVGALARIENGTYGICIRCKHRIRFGQLQKDPTIRLCHACEMALDWSMENFKGTLAGPSTADIVGP
jgi:RNA polymerase-binding transcription factor DksA